MLWYTLVVHVYLLVVHVYLLRGFCRLHRTKVPSHLQSIVRKLRAHNMDRESWACGTSHIVFLDTLHVVRSASLLSWVTLDMQTTAILCLPRCEGSLQTSLDQYGTLYRTLAYGPLRLTSPPHLLHMFPGRWAHVGSCTGVRQLPFFLLQAN